MALLTAPAGSPDPLRRWAAALRLLGPELRSDAAVWLLRLARRRPSRRPVNPALGRAGELRLPPGDPSEGSREAAITWSLPALAAGLDPGPWERFGGALGPPVDLLAGLESLFRDPDEADVVQARLNPVVAALLRLAQDPSELLLAWAGAGGQPLRGFEIRAAVASRADELDAHWRRTLMPEARRSLPRERREPAEKLLGGLEEGFSWYISYLRFMSFGFDHRMHDAPWTPERARGDLGAARELLDNGRDAGWPGSWEVRRGLGEVKERLVGSWFLRGYILRALDLMGEPVAGEIRRLLDEGDPAGLRWYGAWRGVPPDADSLGLALDLAAGIEGFPRSRVERWLEPLWASLPESRLTPTWFYRAPGGPTVEEGVFYLGDDCAAVRLALLLGLARYDRSAFSELIEVNLADLLGRYRPGGFEGVVFYDGAYTEALFLRAAAVLAEGELPASLREGLGRVRREVVERIARTQRLDGGWGSAQGTAFRLWGLATNGGDRRDLLRGVRSLSERQRPDGSWGAEPFYLMPGKGESVAWHQGTELTTAICAWSIAAALNAGGRA